RHRVQHEQHGDLEALAELTRREDVPNLIEPGVLLRKTGERWRPMQREPEVASERIEDEHPEQHEGWQHERVAEECVARASTHAASIRVPESASKQWMDCSGTRTRMTEPRSGTGASATWRTTSSWPSSVLHMTCRSWPRCSTSSTVTGI